jgi:hypothetical protein
MIISKPTWIESLDEFSKRNHGRPTRLEFNDPDFGAQWEELDFPLRGVTYDPRDDRVEIMFGEMGNVRAHLTHSISCPTSVDVQCDEAGRDRTLHIAHGDEKYTLLRLV